MYMYICIHIHLIIYSHLIIYTFDNIHIDVCACVRVCVCVCVYDIHIYINRGQDMAPTTYLPRALTTQASSALCCKVCMYIYMECGGMYVYICMCHALYHALVHVHF